MPKRYLDYLLIPDSGGKIKKQRKKRAIEEIRNREIGEVIILKGKDSEEDVLYLGKIVKKGDRIGFDTFPFHFEKYKDLIKKAIEEDKFPQGVKIELVPTGQTFKEFIYGVLGLEEEKIFSRKLDYEKNRKRKFVQSLNNFVKKIINPKN